MISLSFALKRFTLFPHSKSIKMNSYKNIQQKIFYLCLFLFTSSSYLAAQCNSNIALNSQAEVDAFDCSQINGSLTINGSDITNLDALQRLEFIDGPLSISNNPMLSSLEGLESLQTINGPLVIVFNPQLNNLDGLEGLTSTQSIYLDNNTVLQTVEGFSGLSGELRSFVSIGNTALLNLDGLENIDRIVGTFEISNSPLLENVNGLAGLTYTAITLSFIDVPSLTDISGLSNFVRSDGNVIFVRTGLTDLSGLEALEYVDNILVLEDNPALLNVDALLRLQDANRLVLRDNPQLAACCGLYPIIRSSRLSFVDMGGNLENCNSRLEIVENCKAVAPIDLELNMSISPTAPDAFTFFTQTITLSNNGPSIASEIEVNIPKPAGVVYQGGNEYQATVGVFDTWNTFNWSIFRLEAGATASIEINYYKLNSEDITLYAQVQEVLGVDNDSSPGNGTPPNPNEDDEAAFSTGVSIPLPDLSISNLDAPGNGLAGTVIDFTFDLNNTGTVEVNGAFDIGAYISTDNTLSNNDLLFGIIPTGNTPKGTIADIPGAISIPGNFPAGGYYLILKADISDLIDEQNNNNNIAVTPINISVVPRVCPGDIEVFTQTELNQLAGCEVIEGDLFVSGINGGPDNITDLSPLISLREVTDALAIQNTLISSAEGLNNLERVNRLIFFNNKNVEEITAIRNLEGQLQTLVFVQNQKLESIQPVSGIKGDSLDIMVITGNNQLKNLDGLEQVKHINSLDINGNLRLENIDGLRNLTRVDRDITFVGSNRLENIDGFSSLAEVGRSLVLVDHEFLKDVNGLSQLTNVGGAMVIQNCDQLTNVNALGKLESVGNLWLAENDQLGNCCGVYDLLINNGVATDIKIENNPAFCSSEQDILDNCALNADEIDLELSITVDPQNPSAFTFFSTTLTLSNTGAMKATGIEIAIPAPAGSVYQGGNEFEASQGNFRFWGPQDWLVGDLESGATATITINYYLLTNDPLTFYGQVARAGEDDGDSTPGNGICCTANEDDEASITINQGSSPDLNLSNYDGPDSGMPGDTIGFNFSLNNLGNQVAIGTYQIAAFLSTDNIISADDYLVGDLTTGNTPVGTIADVFNSISIPADISPGAYTLILAADINEAIIESDENNNLLLIDFTILGTNINQQVSSSFKIRSSQLQEIVVEKLYPNPVEEFFIMEFSSKDTEVLPVVIYDALGAAVIHQSFDLQQGKNTKVIDVSQLNAGIYYLRFQIPNRHDAIRFVKVRK